MKATFVALVVMLSSLVCSQSSWAQSNPPGVTVSMQTVHLFIHVPCYNAAHGGDDVVLSGRVRVVSYDPGIDFTGFTTYAGILTGKGSVTGHMYQAVGSTEYNFGSGDRTSHQWDWVYTLDYHVTDQFFKDNGVLFHYVQYFVANGPSPIEVVCR